MSRILSLVSMCARLPRWALAQDTGTPPPPDDAFTAGPNAPLPPWLGTLLRNVHESLPKPEPV